MTRKNNAPACRSRRFAARRRCFLRAVISLLMILTIAAPSFASVMAAELDAEAAQGVSWADVSFSDVPPENVGNFERVSMVPLNVEIPDFYREVVNVSGMYIFTLGDGTVYKRIYGSLDGVYGWYEPVGARNYVLKDSQPIDVKDDIRLYEESIAIEREEIPSQDYFGMLKPDDSVSNVSTVFGVPVLRLVAYSGICVLLICLVILIASLIADAIKRRRLR